MTTLQPHPKYKLSGIEWLGDIPSHWDQRKLKSIVRMRSGEGITSFGIECEGTFPVYGGNGIRGYSESYTHDGDYLLVGRQGALCGNVHRVSGRFWASEHAIVVTPSSEVNVDWFGAVLREMDLNQYSISAAQPGLAVERVTQLVAPLPPLDEQRAIADFLDAIDKKITRFIAARRRMIALLEEQKGAIINQTVTRGLDPDVQLKPSGIDWLGDIPAHWEVRRLSRFVTSIEQGWSPNASNDAMWDDDRWFVVSLSSVKAGKFNKEARKPLAPDVQPEPRLQLRAGDFLLTRANTRQLVGDVAIVNTEVGKLIMSDLIYRLRLREDLVYPAYLLQVFRSYVGRNQIERSARASNETMVKLNHRSIRNWIATTPPLPEQQRIVKHLAELFDKVDTTIARHRREMDLIQEYRTRLISDVVTGKLDVRGVKLPTVEEIIGEEIEEALEDEVEESLADELEEIEA